ncbi:MAG: hypothetical protein ACT6FD_05165 [Methanosarcinaceae archaeon]
MMRKRIYHGFPHRDIQFEQKYRYYSDMPYLVNVMANLNGKFGMFVTESVAQSGHRIQAKREIGVDIMTNSVDFAPLNSNNVDKIIDTIEPEGIIDFKIALKYSYLDEKYNRIPFKGDVFLVRIIFESSIATLQVNHIDGPHNTECGRVADTIIEELRRGA